jgi:hypothetical protein
MSESQDYYGNRVPPLNCACAGCTALKEECGTGNLFLMYRRKLLIRGWAGDTTDAEKLYRFHHMKLARLAIEAGAGTRLNVDRG